METLNVEDNKNTRVQNLIVAFGIKSVIRSVVYRFAVQYQQGQMETSENNKHMHKSHCVFTVTLAP